MRKRMYANYGAVAAATAFAAMVLTACAPDDVDATAASVQWDTVLEQPDAPALAGAPLVVAPALPEGHPEIDPHGPSGSPHGRLPLDPHAGLGAAPPSGFGTRARPTLPPLLHI